MLAIVHDLTDDGISLGDLYEVKLSLLSMLKSLFNRNDTNLVTVRPNETDFTCTDVIVDWRQVLTTAAPVITPDSYIS
jgi:hypothetical protein